MKNTINKSFLRIGSFVMLLGICATAVAQTTISGNVIDGALSEPVIGASVLEVGTTNGTITDFDGNFELTVSPNAELQISYVGYKTQTVKVGNQKVFKIRLSEDSELLEDVVVVGYGTVKKNDATGSVTAINPDDMNKGLQTNAQDMIQGKIAGVNITTDGGTPGGGAAIRIRGGSSLNASNDPLIVVDGLALDNNGILGVSNPLSMINPNDIETFTVLKDASATAIYGSRASNGVILITTKKGKAGQKLTVSYDANMSIGSLTNRMQTLTGDEIRAYAISSGQSMSQNKYLMNENTDWQDQIYRTSVSTDHNISLTGGVKNKTVSMPYRASVGYTLNNGIIKTSQMQRVTANVNLNPSFLDDHLIFNLNAKGMYIYNSYEPGVSGAALTMSPTMPIYSTGDLTGVYGDQLVSKEELDQFWGGYFQPLETSTSDKGPYNDPVWLTQQHSNTTANPVASLNQQSNISNAGSFVGNLEATYRIHGFEDLTLHANFGADYSYGKRQWNNSPYGTASHYYGNTGYEDKMKYNLQFNCYAQYGHDWEEAQQHFDVMAGYEWQHFYNEYYTASNGVYQMTNDSVALRGTAANSYQGEGKGENYLVSFFGRINWVGWNQVMVTATVRGDGSSRFSKANRWGVFPSVAVGWKIKETFMRDINEVSDLKLRLGYGITGQQDGIGDYSYLPTYTRSIGYSAYYPVGVTNYATENDKNAQVEYVVDRDGNILYINDRPNAFNPNLTWEKTTTYNVGLDFGFLNNRINGSIDYYYRATTDLLNNVKVAMGTNFRNKVMSNVGSLTNQGVELALNAVILDYGKKFKWDFGFNFTYNQNKVTKLNNGSEADQVTIDGSGHGGSGNGGSSITKIKVGYATNTFYLYEVEAGEKDGQKVWYVKDQNGDGEINELDKVYKHNPVAPYTMGFQMKFQFYGFDLGMCFRSNIGNYVFNNVKATRLTDVPAGALSRGQYYSGMQASVFDAYYADNYNQSSVLKPNGQPLGGEYDLTNYFLEDASFLRCDNITLGYSFMTKNSKLSGRAYCTVSNPFVITKYTGLDPEVGLSGVDNTIYPRSLTTIMGISLQF